RLRENARTPLSRQPRAAGPSPFPSFLPSADLRTREDHERRRPVVVERPQVAWNEMQAPQGSNAPRNPALTIEIVYEPERDLAHPERLASQRPAFEQLVLLDALEAREESVHLH